MKCSPCFIWKLSLILAGALLMAAAVPAADTSKGDALFNQRCAMCHNKDGKGYPDIKMPDFTSPKWQAATNNKEITETIHNGRKGTSMPAFGDKLKEDEIQALVSYIRAFNSRKKK